MCRIRSISSEHEGGGSDRRKIARVGDVGWENRHAPFLVPPMGAAEEALAHIVAREHLDFTRVFFEALHILILFVVTYREFSAAIEVESHVSILYIWSMEIWIHTVVHGEHLIVNSWVHNSGNSLDSFRRPDVVSVPDESRVVVAVIIAEERRCPGITPMQDVHAGAECMCEHSIRCVVKHCFNKFLNLWPASITKGVVC